MPAPRILITRAAHQTSALADQLRALGADPILIPTIELADPTTFAPLDHALAHLDTFHWLLFTSANAVEAFQRRLASNATDPASTPTKPGAPGLASETWAVSATPQAPAKNSVLPSEGQSPQPKDPDPASPPTKPGALGLASETWVVPAKSQAPAKNSVLLSEGQSPQPKDPDPASTPTKPGAPGLASETWVVPAKSQAPAKNSVLPSEGQSPQPKDPDPASAPTKPGAPGLASETWAVPATAQAPAENSVIPSEGQSPQPKDPDPASTPTKPGAPGLASETWVVSATPQAPAKNSVLPSEGPSPQPKDPDPASPASTTAPLPPPILLPPHLRIAAIGSATARALASASLPVHLLPPQAVAESLAAALLPHALQPDRTPTRFLLLRAEVARDLLPDTLRAAGADVTIAPVYRNNVSVSSIAAIRQLFSSRDRWPAAITFTSSSTATNLLALLEASGLTLPQEIQRISIGPITSQTLRDLNLPPHAEAAEPNLPSLVAEVVKSLGLKNLP